jgi:hypothetical protein
MIDLATVAIRDGVDELKEDTSGTFLVTPHRVMKVDMGEEVTARVVVEHEESAVANLIHNDPMKGDDIRVVRDASMQEVFRTKTLEICTLGIQRSALVSERQAEPLDSIQRTSWVDDITCFIYDAHSAFT